MAINQCLNFYTSKCLIVTYIQICLFEIYSSLVPRLLHRGGAWVRGYPVCLVHCTVT